MMVEPIAASETIDPAELIPASRRCFRCAHWGDGISEDEDKSTWRVCTVDGLNLFANRNYSCRLHAAALTLKTAIKHAKKQMELI